MSSIHDILRAGRDSNTVFAVTYQVPGGFATMRAKVAEVFRGGYPDVYGNTCPAWADLWDIDNKAPMGVNIDHIVAVSVIEVA